MRGGGVGMANGGVCEECTVEWRWSLIKKIIKNVLTINKAYEFERGKILNIDRCLLWLKCGHKISSSVSGQIFVTKY